MQKPMPFKIKLDQDVLDDIQARLTQVRWPNELDETDWTRGSQLRYMKQLATYWREEFDWRKMEDQINAFAHFRTKAQGIDLHFIHERSVHDDATPLLLLHGWNDSFYRYQHMINMLTGNDQPDGKGPHFHVIVPSLPGFDFSDQPKGEDLYSMYAARSMDELMRQLGYTDYLVHGGDFGSVVAQDLAGIAPDQVKALHLSDIPFLNFYMVDRTTISDSSRRFFETFDADRPSMAYAGIQIHKPRSLAYALSDSPIGLAGWLVERFYEFSESMPSFDDILTIVTLYYATNTIRSSLRYYGEGGEDWGDSNADSEASWDETAEAGDTSWNESATKVPAGLAIFPKDITQPPRELAELFFDVRRFSVMPKGGHFAALETPQLLTDDIRAFAAGL